MAEALVTELKTQWPDTLFRLAARQYGSTLHRLAGGLSDKLPVKKLGLASSPSTCLGASSSELSAAARPLPDRHAMPSTRRPRLGVLVRRCRRPRPHH